MNNYKLLEKKHLVRFIEDLQVTEGEIKVPNYIIYYTYRKLWSGVKETRKISRIHFFKLLHFYFKKKWKERSVRGFYFKEGSFDLSLDNKVRARAFDRSSLPITGINRHRILSKYLVGENPRMKKKREEIERIKRELNLYEETKTNKEKQDDQSGIEKKHELTPPTKHD